MTQKAEEKFFCKRCQREISKEKWDEAIKIRWLPLCDECDPLMREKQKKYVELWPKFQQSLAKNFRKK